MIVGTGVLIIVLGAVLGLKTSPDSWTQVVSIWLIAVGALCMVLG